MFSCPRPRPRIWFRETGSAVPSRVSLLISIPRLNLVLNYGIPPEFPSREASFTMYASTQIDVVPQHPEGGIRRFTRYASMPISIVPQHDTDHSILKIFTSYASYPK